MGVGMCFWIHEQGVRDVGIVIMKICTPLDRVLDLPGKSSRAQWLIIHMGAQGVLDVDAIGQALTNLSSAR